MTCFVDGNPLLDNDAKHPEAALAPKTAGLAYAGIRLIREAGLEMRLVERPLLQPLQGIPGAVLKRLVVVETSPVRECPLVRPSCLGRLTQFFEDLTAIVL